MMGNDKQWRLPDYHGMKGVEEKSTDVMKILEQYDEILSVRTLLLSRMYRDKAPA
jgi:hypothetical protein